MTTSSVDRSRDPAVAPPIAGAAHEQLPVRRTGGDAPVTAVLLNRTTGRFSLTWRTHSYVTTACREAAAQIGVDGLGVAMALPGTLRVPLGASNTSARLLELAELTAGEGPCTLAQRTGSVVRTGDLTAVGELRWPTLSRHVRDSRVPVDARAVISVPLTDGRHTFGSVSVHSTRPDGLLGLDETALGGACTAAAATALRAQPGDPDPATQDWATISQAVRGVMAARGVGSDRATSALREAALADRCSLTDVAREVVDGHRPAELNGPPGRGEPA